MRHDADGLGAAAHVIYSGDFNCDSGSFEPGYIDLRTEQGQNLSTNGTPGSAAAPLVAGPAAGFDGLTNESFGGDDFQRVRFYSESADFLSKRDDYQFVTENALPGSTADGLQLVARTYTNFGNTYYDFAGNSATATALYGNVANAANAAALGIPLSVLQDMVFATDHLPVVADYVIAPEPGAGLLALMSLIITRRARTSRAPA